MINHQRRCPKCRSTNVQTFEAAYESSTRISETGYQTMSKTGQRIAPPQPRSVVAGAAFTALGTASGALIFAPQVLNRLGISSMHNLASMDKTNLTIAGCIAILAFVLSIQSRLKYNARCWAPEYLDWQKQSICRSCLHQFDT